MKKRVLKLLLMGFTYSIIGLITQILFVNMLWATDTNAQSVKSMKEVSVNVGFDNKKLVDLFGELELKTPFVFVYDKADPFLSERISLEKKKQSVEDVLIEIAKEKKLRFKQVNNNISVSKASSKEKIIEYAIREFTVNGTVLSSSDGQPIPGATVLVKNSTKGTVTDIDGNFSIEVPDEGAVLVISFVGYISLEITVNNQSAIEVRLEEDYQGLDEVIVVGYGTKKKSNLTAAVEMVNPKVLENRPVRSVAEMLEGAVPGLNVNLTSGAPDATANLNIRGFTGLGTTQSPLILVDGVEQDINTVNPNDVESISVLKDAAASAIYGSRAPFGVIVITTKKGQKGRPMQVDYSTNVQINSPFMLPHTQNSLDFALDMNDAFYNSQQVTGFYPQSTIDNIRRYLAGEIPNNSRIGERDGGNAEDDMRWEAHNYAHSNTDYVGEAFKNHSVNATHNLTISGGDESTTYYLGLGYNSKEGVYNTDLDKFSRYNAMLKVDTDINEWMNVGLNIRYSNIRTTRPNYRGAAGTAGSDGNLWNNISYFPNVPIKNPDGNYHWLSAFPVFDGLQGTFESNEDELWMSPNLVIKPMEGMTIRGQYSRNITYNNNRVTTFEVMVDQGDGTFRRSARSAAYDQLDRLEANRHYYQADFNVEYKKDIDDHHMLFLLGAQQEHNRFNAINNSRRELYSRDFPVLSNAYGTNYTMTERLYEWATRGVYLRASYNYQSKYLLDFNGRYDGSSRFAPESRWSFFPSVSAGYNVAMEEFWPAKEIVNVFKLTGSWGKLGNQRLDVNGNGSTNDNGDLYTYQPVFGTNPTTRSIIEGAQQPYVTSPPLARSDRTWEKPQSIGFGIEAGLFQSRLKIDYHWYQRTTYDALGVAEQLPVVLGTSVPRANNAVTETRGWEVSVDWEDEAFNIMGSPLRYGVRGILSDYIGYVVEYGPGNDAGLRNGTWTPGEVFGQVYGQRFEGIAQNTENMTGWVANGNGFYFPGDVYYKDLDGDGIISDGSGGYWFAQGDRELLGYSYPRYKYGVFLNLGWKNFNFSAFLDGVGQETQWVNNTNAMGHTSTTGWSSRTAYDLHQDLGYWTVDTPDAFFPRVYQNGKNVNRVNDHYMFNLSNLRIKNINLTYAFNQELISRIGLKRASLNASVENIGFIYNNSWLKLDPTLIRNGVSGYPTSRTVSFGLNVGF